MTKTTENLLLCVYSEILHGFHGDQWDLVSHCKGTWLPVDRPKYLFQFPTTQEYRCLSAFNVS